MAREWKLVRLGDILKIEHRWPFKSEMYSDDLTGKPIVVSIDNFNDTGGTCSLRISYKQTLGFSPANWGRTSEAILLVK